MYTDRSTLQRPDERQEPRPKKGFELTADALVGSAWLLFCFGCKYWMKAASKAKMCLFHHVVAQILDGNAADLIN